MSLMPPAHRTLSGERAQIFGEFEFKAASFTLPGFKSDLTVHQMRQVLRNDESKSYTTVHSARRTMKLVKYHFGITLLNANTGINDSKLPPIVLHRRGAYFNPSALCVFERVGKQYVRNVPELFVISFDPRKFPLLGITEFEAFSSRRWLMSFH